jgi:DNA-binding HxlR family transcriptional regulator
MDTREPSALEEAVSRVGDRWTLLVIDALMGGPRRFGQLQDEVAGIAPNILSQRLKALESDGLVFTRPYSRRPPRVAYELSAAGRELAGALRSLAQWGAHSSGVATVRHEACGTPVEARWYCPTCVQMVDDRSDPDVRFV